ncbi:hypothetical protein [Mesorhizobium sp. M0166]
MTFSSGHSTRCGQGCNKRMTTCSSRLDCCSGFRYPLGRSNPMGRRIS